MLTAEAYFDETQYVKQLIELAQHLPQPKILYSSPVIIDNGEFFGELYLLSETLEMVLEKQAQNGRKRKYTWSYHDIANVELDALSEYSLKLTLKAGVIRRVKPLSVSFEFTSQRNKFYFRLKTLSSLYRRRNSRPLLELNKEEQIRS